MCEALAAPGVSIAVHYNQSKHEAIALAASLRAKGAQAHAVHGALEEFEDTDALVQRSAALLGGPLTALINNASVFDYDTPREMKREVFHAAMRVNLEAPLRLSEAFFHQAVAGENNVVVDFLDQKLWNLNPDFFSYTLSKAALQASIEMRAMAYAPRVRVCGVAPGLLFPSFDQTKDEFERVANRNLQHAPISVHDLGSAVRTLVDTRSMNGQVLHIDNGQRFVKEGRDIMFAHREP